MSQADEKTERIYHFLVAEWTQHTDVPSYREIARACGLSVTAVTYHLDKLEEQGRIVRQARQARSIRLVEDEPDADALTEQVYRFICEAFAAGWIPSREEIGAGCYLSRVSVRRHLARLAGQGRIVIGQGIRDIHLIQK